MIACRARDLGTMPYAQAFALQKRELARVQSGGTEAFYLLEHPHVLTVGRNADGSAILAERGFVHARGATIVETDRGGDVTYHGPGQVVGYPLIALEPGRRDIRRYVHDLEDVLIRALSDFGITGARHDVHRGVWVGTRKVGSIGVRISRWVTCHGFALNVNTDLSYFSMITPCGIDGCEMTSMEREIGSADIKAVKASVWKHFGDVFDRTLAFDDCEIDENAHREAHVE